MLGYDLTERCEDRFPMDEYAVAGLNNGTVVEADVRRQLFKARI